MTPTREQLTLAAARMCFPDVEDENHRWVAEFDGALYLYRDERWLTETRFKLNDDCIGKLLAFLRGEGFDYPMNREEVTLTLNGCSVTGQRIGGPDRTCDAIVTAAIRAGLVSGDTHTDDSPVVSGEEG